MTTPRWLQHCSALAMWCVDAAGRARCCCVCVTAKRSLVHDGTRRCAARLFTFHVMPCGQVPLFIWAPEEEGQFQPGRTSRWWTQQSVLDLQAQLQALGSCLVLRRSRERSTGLMQAVADVKAQAVFFNNLYDPISLVSDHEIKQALANQGVACKSFNSDMLYEPWEVLDEGNQPCTTFEDFWGRVSQQTQPPPVPLPPPPALPPLPEALPIASLAPSEIDWFMTKEQEAASDQLRFKWRPGVAGAVAKLEAFFAGKLPVFDHERAKVDRESTSQLSPWIHIGSISTRYIYYRTRHYEVLSAASGLDKGQCCKDFLRQLGYREYARYLAFFFPFIHERSLLAHLRDCPWRMDQAAFKAWRQGQTGYPLVDAAMKQLWSTGWAHNRLRVVAASFAVKNLLLPWQWGLKHFWDAQLDADLENDALGWQYISGGMADAHPFSFILDLGSECRRLDPDGEYVRRWLPALALLPTEFIHAPWTAPAEVLEAADVELGVNYPRPIVSVHESILGLQHAVEVLDASAAAACSERATRHPYRLAHNSLMPSLAAAAPAPPHAAPSVFADPSLGAVAKSWVGTPGTTEATEVHYNHPTSHPHSAADMQPGSNGSSMAHHQQQPGSLLQQRLRNAVFGEGTGTGTGTGATPTATASLGDGGNTQHGGVAAQKVIKPGGGITGGYDYPRYRQSHNKHHGYYIDVRLVPPEEVQAALAAEAAAAPPAMGGSRGYMGFTALKPIPGMRDAAAERAALGQPARDGDSAWAPGRGGTGRRGQNGSFGGSAMSEGSSGASGDDECMSEEVVSNTVGLAMPQASMQSGPAGGRGKRPMRGEDGCGSGSDVEGDIDSGRHASKVLRKVPAQGAGHGHGHGAARVKAPAAMVEGSWPAAPDDRVEGEGEASAGGYRGAEGMGEATASRPQDRLARLQQQHPSKRAHCGT